MALPDYLSQLPFSLHCCSGHTLPDLHQLFQYVLYVYTQQGQWCILITILPSAMGVLWLIQISSPASSPWLTNSVNFTPLYFWLSLALNLSMTLAIVARLLFFRWRIARALGAKFGSQYTSIAAIVVESAFISSAGFLLFLIPFGINSPLANLFIQPLSEIQVRGRLRHLSISHLSLN